MASSDTINTVMLVALYVLTIIGAVMFLIGKLTAAEYVAVGGAMVSCTSIVAIIVMYFAVLITDAEEQACLEKLQRAATSLPRPTARPRCTCGTHMTMNAVEVSS